MNLVAFSWKFEGYLNDFTIMNLFYSHFLSGLIVLPDKA